MRVTLLCADRGVPLGGAKGCSVHLRAVARALRRAGHGVEARVATRGEEADVSALEQEGVRVHPLAPGDTAAALALQLSDAGCDLVLERLALLDTRGAEAAASLGLPHVYEVNAPLDAEAAAWRRFTQVEDAREHFRRGFAASRAAVAVSGEVARWVTELAPAGYPVRVLENGAPPEFFRTPDVDAVERVRAACGARSRGFTIGFFGSFRPWHDLEGLVHAVSQVPRAFAPRLLLVGDGPSREDVFETGRRLGVRIAFAGIVPHEEIPPHLAICDVVAVPYSDSLAYFSPLKLVEAMAAGRAVVASRTPAVEQMLVHGRTGWLVRAGDRESLAQGLSRLAGDPELRTRLAAAARTEARRRFHWDRIVERLLEFAAVGGVGGSSRHE